MPHLQVHPDHEPSQEDLQRAAHALDVCFEERSQHLSWLHQGDRYVSSPQDIPEGRLAAWGWLELLQRLVEPSDTRWGQDPLPRRRLLWRR